MNEYEITLLSSCIIECIFVFAYFASSTIQSLWAWVDDSERDKQNWLSGKFKSLHFTKWRYPVYSGGYCEGADIFGYAKEPKLNKAEIYGLRYGKDYLYDHDPRTFRGYWGVAVVAACSPCIILLSIKLYAMTLIIVVLVCLLYLTRFVRRLNKKLKQHTENTEIHTHQKG